MQNQSLSDFNVALCKRLKRCREATKLSYKELEELTGISRSTLQRYETGKSTNITSTRLMSIAKAFNVSVGYLMGWESKDLPDEYIRNLTPLIEELGYSVSYDSETETFSLIFNNFSFPISIEELKDIKNSTVSYLKFKLNEITNPNINSNP